MLKKIMQKANAKKNQKGFTLIELLAVIVILAILAAIAIPSVISIMNTQSNKGLAQNGVNVIHVVKLYIADTNTDTSKGFSIATDDDALQPYIDKAGDVNGKYTVTVATDGTYSVAGKLPPANDGTATTSANEADLINYAKNGKW